ncbi:TPA: hypothetical protein R4368_001061 [Yersinia enterocolitica]|nr:hypothetical protein [Yersinia enterocolitica]ELI8355419.1 hypothetical protein [Yersinia enterocolitica]HDL7373529.1 hypothetical protein [Yersinia enterocolitica]HED4491651.1 hypothetical protein [Yersinia enterocolitica]HEN3536721.1 hypothetical protein [Yersinia enterocolitica]
MSDSRDNCEVVRNALECVSVTNDMPYFVRAIHLGRVSRYRIANQDIVAPLSFGILSPVRVFDNEL